MREYPYTLAEEIISHIRALVFLVYFKNAAPNKYNFLYFPNLLIWPENWENNRELQQMKGNYTR